MEKWQISEFSKLTGVSVRTLHYYDSLGLLIPSERLQNGFRLYGKKDLQILLQILSLKFLKFDLVTIKGLLNGSILVQEEFLAQKKRLAKKLDKLAKAKKILENVASVTGSAPLDLVLKLIEMYRAAYHLDKMRIRKLLPKQMLAKTAEYKERIHSVLQQIDTITHDDLFTLCTDFLKEAYQVVPGIMRYQLDAV